MNDTTSEILQRKLNRAKFALTRDGSINSKLFINVIC